MSKNLIQRFENADDIYDKFLRNNPGYISKELQKKINYFNYIYRAYNFLDQDLKRSLSYWLKAVFKNPLSSIHLNYLLRFLYKSIVTKKI